jgi:hypothetical protein
VKKEKEFVVEEQPLFQSVSIYLPVDVHSEAKVWAARRRMALKDYIIMAIRDRINTDEKYK